MVDVADRTDRLMDDYLPPEHGKSERTGDPSAWTWTAEGLLAEHPRPTGVWILPPRLASWLGFWSAWRQRSCPHPPHRARSIHGDERLYGYRAQCMECGVFAR